MPAPVARSAHPRRTRRGSLLIVAMLLAAAIGISLVSYLKLGLNSLTLADRSFHQTSAINLAEMGVEEAMYCYNQLDNVSDPRTAWTGTAITWTIASDNSVSATLPTLTLGPGVTGVVRVYCTHYNPSGSPVIVAKTTVTPQRGPTLEKWLEITLRKRSLFANGLVARNTIIWSGGNATADSWNSDPDNNPATASVTYATGPARASATVGTPNPANNALDFGGGTIRGRLMNAGGTISRTSGAILSSTTSGTGWDTALISGDFSATFPTITVPAPPALNTNRVASTSPIAFPSTLPRGTDRAWNGVYYYDFASNYGLSAAGPAANKLIINGPVVFLATNHVSTSPNLIDLGGNASIGLTTSGTLKVYTTGNIEASGNGMTNANASPSTLQIYGTHPTAGGQTIRFVGNGNSSAAIYAPNATFQLRGNGALYGAVVANDIALNGNAAFHYDEALGNTSAGNPFGIIKWRELQTREERTTGNAARAGF
jgi:hypothetical protein